LILLALISCLTAQQPAREPADNLLLARPEQHMFLRPYFLLEKQADKTMALKPAILSM
jgi:hypothetical protein